jgi:hypothetical protein
MSTAYATLKRVSARELFNGRLEAYGVREHFENETNKTTRWLTDGGNYLSVSIKDDGFVHSITRLGANAPSSILSTIAEVFDTDVVSEYEPEFWGFDTQEEWDAWTAQRSKDANKKFHAELMKYVAGEPDYIRPGTIGKIQAEIAKKTCRQRSRRASPANK